MIDWGQEEGRSGRKGGPDDAIYGNLELGVNAVYRGRILANMPHAAFVQQDLHDCVVLLQHRRHGSPCHD